MTCKRRFRLVDFRATVLVLLLVATASSIASAQNPKILAGFFEEWGIYYANYDLSDLYNNGSAAKLSHLIYAFGNVYDNGHHPGALGPSGLCYIADTWADYQTPYLRPVDGIPDTGNLHGNFSELKKLKQLYPNLKVLISLGGANDANAQAFSTAASTQAGRQALVSSCLNMFITGNVGNDGQNPPQPVSAANIFDGFNIDWEFPAAADKHNFTLLLQEFRNQLNALGQQNHKTYILTFDGPAGSENYTNIELCAAAQQSDFITVDGYNYAGSWDTVTNHASPFYDTPNNPLHGIGFDIDDTVSAYLNAGVPGSKFITGVPLFGPGWSGVANVNHGLYQNSNGPSPVYLADGSGLCPNPDPNNPSPGCDPLLTPGVLTYRTLAILENSRGYTSHFWYDADAVTLYNPNTQIFFSYDDADQATERTSYVNQQNLGGAFVWAVKDDDTNGTMVKTLATGLGR